ncbi:hypothetical protein MNBD_ALPHA03-1097 [hydrothermal vent metagenome]|uniref:NnrS protein involved in response to NO n=1 Tax=hydrothermal vent metagenome TaxID=652676 RepID=A0A3B1B3V1_9ZZZZ
MIGANFLSGAGGRLLPPSIPFRYFTVGVIFYVVFWAALFVSADDLTSYTKGGGPILSVIHMATLGVLSMTVIGASLQLLSVATRKAFKGFWLCRLVSWFYIPGIFLITYAMYISWHSGMLMGAGLTGGGLLIFCGLIIHNIWGVTGMAAIMAHCWAAMLSLMGLLGLGILLIVNAEHGFMPDHFALATSHFILAVFGFMTLLAMGFSYILIPMFALSPGPPEGLGRWSIGCNITGLIGILIGVNIYLDWLVIAGIGFIFSGVGLYIYAMTRVYKARMRKRLGLPFILIRISWVMLLISVIWGAVGAAGYWPDRGHTLFAAAAIGWLLTFLMGVLQRIIPFLASMHSSGHGGVPLLTSAMADERLLTVNVLGHLAGLSAVILGIMFDWDMVIRAGAVMGFAGAMGLLIYLMYIIRHLASFRGEKA